MKDEEQTTALAHWSQLNKYAKEEVIDLILQQLGVVLKKNLWTDEMFLEKKE